MILSNKTKNTKMWVIQLVDDTMLLTPNNFAGLQMLETHIVKIYHNIEHKTCEDYKRLHCEVERHIVDYCNAMKASAVELCVYTYGFDNAIPLLHNYNIRNDKRYLNTSSKSLLFAIIYNRFSIYYIQTPQHSHSHSHYKGYHRSILTIQRFWRKVLKHKRDVIDNEITYLIQKINKEIIGESTKKVLIYMVNKFRRRLNKTLRL
jgi:hypothetical protein